MYKRNDARHGTNSRTVERACESERARERERERRNGRKRCSRRREERENRGPEPAWWKIERERAGEQKHKIDTRSGERERESRGEAGLGRD